MGHNESKKTTKNRAATKAELLPTPSKIRLSTPDEIRHEMARVYREARAQQLESQEATRLVYILSQIAKAYELAVIERRIMALEAGQSK